MNFDLADELNNYLIGNKLEEAIELAESKLKELPETDFHKVLNRNLKPLAEELTNYLTEFYKNAKNKIEVKAIYSEMNGFNINYDLWFIDLFAYTELGTLDDLDWLSEFGISSNESMVIRGFEDLQAVFEDYIENEKWEDEKLEQACEICELLIVLRLQELFKQAKKIAVEKDLAWRNIPLFATAHDYDLVYEVRN